MNSNRRYPGRLDDKRYARNGFVPEDSFLRRVLGAQNHVLSYRRKVFLSTGCLASPFGGALGTTTRFYLRCHSGIGAARFVFRIGLGLCDGSLIASTDPYVTLDVVYYDGGGVKYPTTVEVHHGINSGETFSDTPFEIAERVERVDVVADTDYEVSVSEVDGARILWLAIYEEAPEDVNPSTPWFVDEGQGVVGYPVLDATRERTLRGLSEVWRRNGPHLVTFTGQLTAPTYTDATWRNVIDASTSFSSTSAGYWLGDDDALYTLSPLCRFADNDEMDAVLCVYGSCANGTSTGEVRFENAGGVVCSLTGVTTVEQWYTSAVTLSQVEQLAKCDLEARLSAATANTFTLKGVSLYAYLA